VLTVPDGEGVGGGVSVEDKVSLPVRECVSLKDNEPVTDRLTLDDKDTVPVGDELFDKVTDPLLVFVSVVLLDTEVLPVGVGVDE
jgi:hypothetical protein